MNQKYNKTENPKGRSGHSVPLQDRHNASSRPRLFFRLGCAALALMLAVGGVSLLRSSFEAQLPMVHAATGATISEAAGQTWEANVNMSPGDTSIQVCKIFLLSMVFKIPSFYKSFKSSCNIFISFARAFMKFIIFFQS